MKWVFISTARHISSKTLKYVTICFFYEVISSKYELVTSKLFLKRWSDLVQYELDITSSKISDHITTVPQSLPILVVVSTVRRIWVGPLKLSHVLIRSLKSFFLLSNKGSVPPSTLRGFTVPVKGAQNIRVLSWSALAQYEMWSHFSVKAEFLSLKILLCFWSYDAARILRKPLLSRSGSFHIVSNLLMWFSVRKGALLAHIVVLLVDEAKLKDILNDRARQQ